MESLGNLLVYKDKDRSPNQHNRKHSYLYPILRSHATGITLLVPRSPEPLPCFLLSVEELSVLHHPPVQKGKPWAHCVLELTQVLLQGQEIEVGKKKKKGFLTKTSNAFSEVLKCILALPVTVSLHRMPCLKEIKSIGRIRMIQTPSSRLRS